MKFKSKIIGTGHYVPGRVVTNDDLSTMMETSDEWIVERTGINERRWFEAGKDTVSKMGTAAARNALASAGVEANEVDFIVFATLSPDYYFPGCGVLVQEQLGIDTVGALDVRNQCSGFLYGLSIADQFIKTGMYKTILVIGSEIQSNIMDKSSNGRSMAVIFGDGAGAVLVQATEEEDRGILSTHLHSEGQHALELTVKEPSTLHNEQILDRLIAGESKEDLYPYMNGPFVFKHAVVRFMEVIGEALDANQMTTDEIDLFIPHQANLRIAQYVQKKLQLADEQVWNNIQRYGNTTAASIPIALSEANDAGKLKTGDILCLAAFGSGFTWASALIRW
ncbi:MAG: ketoacyl-ACP synthase III [Flavobacteriales bacterium]|nr:ketoacyl-ACP synthase III [Flavobacteriales bacterium]MBL4735591.1 ketoacyl-ACP synthase III [Flavobacteriales bacterium]